MPPPTARMMTLDHRNTIDTMQPGARTAASRMSIRGGVTDMTSFGILHASNRTFSLLL